MKHYDLNTEELRALIQGKYSFHNCLECGGTGKVLVDGDKGIVVKAPHPDADPEIYYEDECYECDSLGGRIVWKTT